MKSQRTSFDYAVGTVRWLARGLSVVSICTLALFVIGDAPNPSRVTAPEWLALVFFPVGVVVGMVVAWKWEGVGSGIGLASLALFYVVYALLLSRGLTPGWWFMIFSLPLALFLIAWAATRIRARRDNDELSAGDRSNPGAGLP